MSCSTISIFDSAFYMVQFFLLHQASQMRTNTCKTVPNHKLITPANVSISKKGRKYVDPNLALEDVYQMCNRMRPV